MTVGTTYQIDRVGNRDKCVVINTSITANPVCPQGRELRRRTGRDQCRQIVRATSCPGVSGVPGVSGTVGTVLAIDRIGRSDRCVVPNTAIMVMPACPIGLSRTTRTGRDDCRG